MRLVTVAQMTVRICGLLLILLGVLLWIGNFDQLKDIHKLLGIILVLGLWTLAFIGARSGVPLGFVVVAVAWGLIAPIVGLTQEGILTGGAHWVIQVIHLLIGLGAIGISERLARMIKGRAPAPAHAA
ncbi:MAG TPA: hypothetical protein VET26_07630 [Candidatus Sulfotelmatobacter sp.]|nr:hypothetical protein [Candidatus Sulfotelmatobacter sp.]